MRDLRLHTLAACIAALALCSCGKEESAPAAVKKVAEEKVPPYTYPAPVKGHYKEINIGEFDVVDGIAYYSWGGVAVLTNPIDPIDPFIGTFSRAVPGDSDGIVPRCSNHLGIVIRDDYLQNHPDEANLVLQLVSPLGTNPKERYRAHANRWKLAGL